MVKYLQLNRAGPVAADIANKPTPTSRSVITLRTKRLRLGAAVLAVLTSTVALVISVSTHALASPADQFTWPVTGHTDANDVAWHQAQESGSRAVDIQAPLSIEVGAAQSGVVTVAFNGCPNSDSRECGHGFGNYVVVRHDRAGVSNPLYTLYGHLNSSLAVSVGTTVNIGQTLGVIAMSGKTDGPHTHFAISICANAWWGDICTIWRASDTTSTPVHKGEAIPGNYGELVAPSSSNSAAADVYAVVRNDTQTSRTAVHVVNGSNWGHYLQNAPTGLPATDGSWSFDYGDYNRDGVADLWAFNRNPGGSNTVVHVLNGANLSQWLQAGNIALPGTDAGWSFKVADFNRDGVADIFGINSATGWPHTAVHVINGSNWGQWLQAGNIALPGTDANWDFDVADFNRDGIPDIWGFNRAPGYPHTVVHVINGSNWGLWLQAGNIGLPSTDSTWSFAVGDQNGDSVPDLFGINRAPGYPHTVVHVINGANWGQWLQAGDIALPSTDTSWDFAVADYR